MSFNMCLYLYYFGNNLSRYGFTRGVVSESERNKGMEYGGNVYDYMSETDRQFFGITEDTDNSMTNDLDITSMIQANRGFISTKELHQALTDMGDDNSSDRDAIQNKRYNNPMMGMDPYQRQIYQEMQQAQKESEAFNQRLNLGNSYRNMENDYETIDDDGFDANLFSELND